MKAQRPHPGARTGRRAAPATGANPAPQGRRQAPDGASVRSGARPGTRPAAPLPAPRQRRAEPPVAPGGQRGADPGAKRAAAADAAAGAAHAPQTAPAPAVAQVTIDAETAGQRIDNFLLGHLKGVPRSHLYRVLRRGEVRVNKGRVQADYRLEAGDLVRIPPLRTALPNAPVRAPDRELARLAAAVLYEDERLLVIDKPAGLAVHGGSGLSYGLIESLRQLRPGAELELVHRLDRDTSGCLLISKRRSTLRELHRLIAAGEMDKRYLALILGELPTEEVTVDVPLTKNIDQGGERVVKVDRVGGKPARTRFRRLRRLSLGGLLDGPPDGRDAEGGPRVATLVEARLFTGRTHQIRVHAAHLGAPLAGDPKYGDFEANRRLKTLGLDRLFLHATAVGLRAEYMKGALRIESPLPPLLDEVLRHLQPL